MGLTGAGTYAGNISYKGERMLEARVDGRFLRALKIPMQMINISGALHGSAPLNDVVVFWKVKHKQLLLLNVSDKGQVRGSYPF